MADVEIRIPTDELACWMTINNRLHGKPPGFLVWDGVLFSLIKQFEVHPTGTWKNGLAAIELKGPSFERVITASEFDNGDFLFITSRNLPSGPSSDPLEDAKKFWDPTHAPAGPREFSTHVQALKGGIVVWRHKQDEVKFRMADSSPVYEFEITGPGDVDVQHLNYNGVSIPPIPSGKVKKIILKKASAEDGDGGPGDIMMPPRYP